VLGHVDIAAKASVWFHAVVRGDSERITIGEGCNVQDQAVLHADPGFPCLLGHRVTVGHAAIVHGATIEDDVLIGMRAVVMNGARIGRGSLVGVGAVVLEGMDIPPESVVVGMPATLIRRTSDKDWERIRHAANHYIAAAREYARQYPRGESAS
jgi:carbonic anhydrase/acetyltransferase-like protein (isoleucine patch superfamily)